MRANLLIAAIVILSAFCIPVFASAAPTYDPSVCSLNRFQANLTALHRKSAALSTVNNQYAVGIRTIPESGLTPSRSAQATIDLTGSVPLCSGRQLGTIDWGDGSTQRVTMTSPGCKTQVSATFSHTYARKGTYDISFTSFEGMPVGRRLSVGRAEPALTLCTKDVRGKASLSVSIEDVPKNLKLPKNTFLSLYENESDAFVRKLRLKNKKATFSKLDFGETYYAVLSMAGYARTDGLVQLSDKKTNLSFDFDELVKP